MNEKWLDTQSIINQVLGNALPFHKEKAPFPYVWIITDHKYPIKTAGFRVFQSKNVEAFKRGSHQTKGRTANEAFSRVTVVVVIRLLLRNNK